MAIRQRILRDSKRKKAERLAIEIQRKVFLKTEWKDKCPHCGGKVKVVWVSKDKKTKAYKCLKGHPKAGQIVNEAWLVRE